MTIQNTVGRKVLAIYHFTILATKNYPFDPCCLLWATKQIYLTQTFLPLKCIMPSENGGGENFQQEVIAIF